MEVFFLETIKAQQEPTPPPSRLPGPLSLSRFLTPLSPPLLFLHTYVSCLFAFLSLILFAPACALTAKRCPHGQRWVVNRL